MTPDTISITCRCSIKIGFLLFEWGGGGLYTAALFRNVEKLIKSVGVFAKWLLE